MISIQDQVLELLFQGAVDTQRGCDGCLYCKRWNETDPGDIAPINGYIPVMQNHQSCEADRPVDCQEVLILARDLVLRCEEAAK